MVYFKKPDMKQFMPILFLSIYFPFSMISCSIDDESECSCCNNHGFIIKFPDGNNIDQNDIAFYDSSTCILFLKDKIHMPIRNSSNSRNLDFSVCLNTDLIYEGTFFPAFTAMVAPSPIYIALHDNSDSINSEFLHFKYRGFPKNSDNRNESRLIDFFDKNKLLRKGIICSIDNIEVLSLYDSVLNIMFTIKNRDDIIYLIPDANKMNSSQFRMLTGGFRIKNIYADEGLYEKIGNSILDKNLMSINYLTVLDKLNEISFNINIPYKFKIENGKYVCEFTFGNIGYLKFISLSLNQDNNRVWIGETSVIKEFEIK